MGVRKTRFPTPPTGRGACWPLRVRWAITPVCVTKMAAPTARYQMRQQWTDL